MNKARAMKGINRRGWRASRLLKKGRLRATKDSERPGGDTVGGGSRRSLNSGEGRRERESRVPVGTGSTDPGLLYHMWLI